MNSSRVSIISLFSKPLRSADPVVAEGNKYSKELKSARSEKGEIIETLEEFIHGGEGVHPTGAKGGLSTGGMM
jgi:hypothetical protein